MSKEVVIIGAGGHSKVIADIIEKSGDIVKGFLADYTNGSSYNNYKLLGKISDCIRLQNEDKKLYFVIAIGNNYVRKKISEYKLNYYTAIHPNAVISETAKIDIGTMVTANVCINSNSNIGKHCIINTGSIVEHDDVIEDYVHISPNATLCGTVKIGECTHIGASATVTNNLSVTKECIIGAGAVVVNDVIEKGTYVGVPAKMIKGK